MLIRLAMPHRLKRQVSDVSVGPAYSSSSTVPELSGELEVSYGARAEEMAEFIQAAMKTVGHDKQSDVSTPSASWSASLSIVGFSIDVGPACWDDALAATALSPSQNSGAPPASLGPGEAVPSTALIEDINTAVAVAMKVARSAACAARTITSLTMGADRETEDMETHGFDGNRPSSTPPSPLPFSFRRLHVTGLGEGGARGEPLAALEVALSRHLPAVGSGDCKAVGASSKPIVVSADATEHLVAGGAWSTVTSVIGRKVVSPADASMAAQLTEKEVVDSVGTTIGATTSPSAGMMTDSSSAGGVMYYIDDGCYGSLSGALLRGVQMQPSPLILSHNDFDVPMLPVDGNTSVERRQVGRTCSTPPGASVAVPGTSVPCTVWGPTCDGLDCVSRVTPLPDDMEPGRDWLFFTDTGLRAGADATSFNGLKPLDYVYCVRHPASGLSTAPVVSLSPAAFHL